MSSQESTSLLPPHPTGAMDAAPPSKQHPPGRMRHVTKKRKRRRGPPAPPSRLGWLGGGLGGGNDDDHDNIGEGEGSHKSGSQSSGGLLTPRPDHHGGVPAGASAGSAAAIDLTNDNDDFAFRASPPAATSNSNDGKGKNDTQSNHDNHGEWPCRRCTLRNSSSASVCAACGSRRESTRGGKKPAGEEEREAHGDSNRDKDGSMNWSMNGGDGSKRHSKKKRSHARSNNGDPQPVKGALWKWASSSQPSSSQPSFSTLAGRRSKFHSSSTSAQRPSNRNAERKAATRSTNDTAMMWIDKHAPRTAKDLCVAPKKIDEVRQFVRSHVEYVQSRRTNTHNNNANNNDNKLASSQANPWDPPAGTAAPQTKLMVLVGSPGVGKSATVRTLARELHVEILTWDDAHVDYHNHRHHGSNNGDYIAEDYIAYQSQLASFEEFLGRSGAGMDSLDVGGMDDATFPNAALQNGRNEKGRKPKKERKGECAGSLILIEDIPNLHTPAAAQSFRNILERHVRRTQTPTILIFSDVREGKHKPEDLEWLLSPNVLYSSLVQILPVQPVTKAKMKKCLQNIAKAEGLAGLLSADFCEEAHLAGGGDLRHAIFAMQFRCASAESGGGGGDGGNDGTGARKDAKLSTFHALGKLLYAKRKPVRVQYDSDLESVAAAPLGSQSKWDDGRGPLDFVPEEILEQVDMGVSSAMSFLSYHGPDFFTDATDLSRSLALLSDAAVFLDRFGQDDGPFPMGYAACLGGRAVAEGNKHPAPPQFRQLTAPKVFGVLRKRRENEARIGQLRKRLSMGGGAKTSMHDNIGSAHQFVTDSLPFMRTVMPQDINYALANLHSYAKESNGEAPAEAQPAIEEENNVLLDDDLVDDDDDGW